MSKEGEQPTEDLKEMTESATSVSSLKHKMSDSEKQDFQMTDNPGDQSDEKETSSEPQLKRRKLDEQNTPETTNNEQPSEIDSAGVDGAGNGIENSVDQAEDEDKMGMHEFEIIDEVAADEDDQDDDDDEQESDESLDDSELYALLEEGITKDSISQSDQPIQKEKVVLVERGHDPFDILPEGWLVVVHNSGMPVYLHRQSRVCTLAQPYFLGSGSARKHDIPISAVPCLKYKRELEKECQAQKETSEQTQTTGNTEASIPSDSTTTDPVATHPTAVSPVVTESVATDSTAIESAASESMVTESVVTDSAAPSETMSTKSAAAESVSAASISDVQQPATTNGETGSQQNGQPEFQKPELTTAFPAVKIKSADERKKETSLDHLKLRDYCEKLFEFKTVTVQRYKTWKDRRKHMGSRKQSRPELPSSTKLITCSMPSSSNSTDKKKAKGKEFCINPSGKSYVCILHEYVQLTMKIQPFYVFKELENSKTPYSATVMINDMEYATGCAISKKLAKSEAAKDTLKILIPEMNTLTDEQLQKNTDDLSFFDEIKIEDPRINDLGIKAGQPSPYQILRECLSRNYGMGDTDCLLDMKPLKHQKCEFTITVGKHKATVIAKSKRSGKQRAAQAILQKLHPHVPSWGSLLRLYGNTADRGQFAKKKEVNEVKRHRPNQAILDRLREEMKRLSAQRDAIKSHGLLVVNSEDLPNKVTSVDL